MMGSRLTQLESTILDHIDRYRIGLTKFCWSAVRAHGMSVSPSQVKCALLRLSRDSGYLARAPLFGSQRYFYPTRKYAREFGETVANNRGRPLAEPDKLTAYAMLRTCFGNAGPTRRKLTVSDFETHFPELAEELGISKTAHKADRYYLADDRLGVVRVDRGGTGRWDRVLGYCDRDITRHLGTRCCRQLVESGYFELTLVTATAQKARRLRRALNERPIHEKVAIHVQVAAELLHILSPPCRVAPSNIPQRGF